MSGPVERERYGDVPFARQRGIGVAVRKARVAIYAVDQFAIDGRPWLAPVS